MLCSVSAKVARMSKVLQHLVSKQKRRLVVSGFDLDLTYITDQVIAMGLPASGVTGIYRNPQSEVIRFLDSFHGGEYKIYNLCTRPQDQYPPEKFGGAVVRAHAPCGGDGLVARDVACGEGKGARAERELERRGRRGRGASKDPWMTSLASARGMVAEGGADGGCAHCTCWGDSPRSQRGA